MSLARDNPHVYFESQGGWPAEADWHLDGERWATAATWYEPTEEDWSEYQEWAERTDGAAAEEEEPDGRCFEDPPW